MMQHARLPPARDKPAAARVFSVTSAQCSDSAMNSYFTECGPSKSAEALFKLRRLAP